eukprot:5009391-Pleurochrysis_carterae.AAC.1
MYLVVPLGALACGAAVSRPPLPRSLSSSRWGYCCPDRLGTPRSGRVPALPSPACHAVYYYLPIVFRIR